MSRNKKKKYYDGPGGVFYNPALDYIFIAEPTHGRWLNLNTGEDLGGVYEYQDDTQKIESTALGHVDKAIYLGDL